MNYKQIEAKFRDLDAKHARIATYYEPLDRTKGGMCKDHHRFWAYIVREDSEYTRSPMMDLDTDEGTSNNTSKPNQKPKSTNNYSFANMLAMSSSEGDNDSSETCNNSRPYYSTHTIVNLAPMSDCDSITSGDSNNFNRPLSRNSSRASFNSWAPLHQAVPSPSSTTSSRPQFPIKLSEGGKRRSRNSLLKTATTYGMPLGCITPSRMSSALSLHSSGSSSNFGLDTASARNYSSHQPASSKHPNNEKKIFKKVHNLNEVAKKKMDQEVEVRKSAIRSDVKKFINTNNHDQLQAGRDQRLSESMRRSSLSSHASGANSAILLRTDSAGSVGEAKSYANPYDGEDACYENDEGDLPELFNISNTKRQPTKAIKPIMTLQRSSSCTSAASDEDINTRALYRGNPSQKHHLPQIRPSVEVPPAVEPVQNRAQPTTETVNSTVETQNTRELIPPPVGNTPIHLLKEFYDVHVKIEYLTPILFENAPAQLKATFTDLTDPRKPSFTFDNLRINNDKYIVFKEPNCITMNPIDDIPWVNGPEQIFEHTFSIEITAVITIPNTNGSDIPAQASGTTQDQSNKRVVNAQIYFGYENEEPQHVRPKTRRKPPSLALDLGLTEAPDAARDEVTRDEVLGDPSGDGAGLLGCDTDEDGCGSSEEDGDTCSNVTSNPEQHDAHTHSEEMENNATPTSLTASERAYEDYLKHNHFVMSNATPDHKSHQHDEPYVENDEEGEETIARKKRELQRLRSQMLTMFTSSK